MMKTLKYILFFFFFLSKWASGSSHILENPSTYLNKEITDTISIIHFFNAYDEISHMLKDEELLNFKNAVIKTEIAYLNGNINEDIFNSAIHLYTLICKGILMSDNINYTERDKEIALTQCAVFALMTDSIPIPTIDGTVIHVPFSYNHEDFAGQKDWSNMFVSKLMETNIGNCHSLPYLYKIIMDELGYKSHLALAPNHIYIKANNKKVGWYNIELTCADFPPMRGMQHLVTYTPMLSVTVSICVLFLTKKQLP